ncbi:acyltransferase family protein [Fervidobacterium sp.]
MRRKIELSEGRTTTRKRELWIDYARGLALIMVVLAHSQIPDKFFGFVSYVIVVFPFISGYLMKDMKLKELIKKRFTLVIAYYYIGFICYLIWVLLVPTDFRKADNLTYLKNFLLVRTDLLQQIPLSIVPLWYLIFLFFSELMYQTFKKLRILPYAIVAGIITRFFHPFSIPFKLDVAFSGLYMFWFGRIMREKERTFAKFLPVLGLSGFIVWLLIAFFVSGTSWNVDEYGPNPFLTLIGEIGTAIFFFWIGKAMEKFSEDVEVSKNVFKKIISKYLFGIPKLFSDNSIFAFGYHILIGGFVVLITMTLGFTVTEETLRVYWYITFSLSFGSILILMLILPKSVKLLLTQPDVFLRSVRNTEKNKWKE